MQYVIGKGEGKRQYLTHIFLNHTRTHGGAYFDFTGDITDILAGVERPQDTVLFLPTDTERPIGYNFIHNGTPQTANAVLDTVKAAWHYEGSTPLLDLYTYTTAAALSAVPDATLLGVPYLLTSDDYREKVIGHIHDPVLKTFWDVFYPSIPDRDKRHDTMSTLNKFFLLVLYYYMYRLHN
jgi:hypothetical protein